MKHLKKIIAVLAIIGITQISYSENLWVDEINVIDANTISVMLSDNPNLNQGEVEWEITILNDLSIRWAITSDISGNSVEIMLEDPILPNTKYSLLTISGADGSIDFETPQAVDGFSAVNISGSSSQNIDSIEILDDRTLIVHYVMDVSASSYEYKLLAESRVTKIEKPDYFISELVISIEPPLVSNKDYILMFIDMPDAAGNYLEFDTWIYDFTTQEIVTIENNIEETIEELPEEIENFEDNMEADENSENLDFLREEDENTMGEVDMEAAPEVSLEKDSQIDTLEVANQIQETPDTGAETWVLIFATLFINTFFYLSRRKKAILTA